MECLPKNAILEYNPDTMVAIRKKYNLDKPGQMDEAIDLLDAWIKKQDHFVRKDFSREYLERVIILLKGSVERAKAQIDKISTLRTLLPHFFDKYEAKNDLIDVQNAISTSLLPKLTEDHYRMLMIKYSPTAKFSSKLYLKIYAYIVLICEYMKAHDYSDGIIFLLDFRDVNVVDFATQINLSEMRQIATIAMEGYDTRAKNFFVISNSKAIEVLVSIFKQVLSDKLGKRMFVLKTIEELYERIPKELLPADYGGKEKPLAELNDKLKETLCSEENIKYFKEMSMAKTDERMRNTFKFNEQYLGLAGTFRTLTVD